jgi:hypothetical protein
MYTLYNAILLLNVGYILTGLAIFAWYAPNMYDHISKKFFLGIYIMIIGVTNLLYLMSFPPS